MTDLRVGAHSRRMQGWMSLARAVPIHSTPEDTLHQTAHRNQSIKILHIRVVGSICQRNFTAVGVAFG